MKVILCIRSIIAMYVVSDNDFNIWKMLLYIIFLSSDLEWVLFLNVADCAV